MNTKQSDSLYVYINHNGGTHLDTWQGSVTPRTQSDTDIFVLRRNEAKQYGWVYACADPTPQLAAESLHQRKLLRVGDVIVDRMEGSIHDEVLIVRAAHHLNQVVHLKLRDEALQIAEQAQADVRMQRTPAEFSWHHCEFTPARTENALEVGDSARIRSGDRLAVVRGHDSLGSPDQEFVVIQRDRMAVGFQTTGQVISTHDNFAEAQQVAMERVNDSWGWTRLQQESFSEFERPQRLLDKAMEREQEKFTSSVRLSLDAWEEEKSVVAEADRESAPVKVEPTLQEEPRTWVMRHDGRKNTWQHVMTAKTFHLKRVQERVTGESGGAQTGDLYLCSNGKAYRQSPTFSLQPDNSTAAAVLLQKIRELRREQQVSSASQQHEPTLEFRAQR